MKKQLTFMLLSLSTAAAIQAQTTNNEISAGPGYAFSGYYKFSDGSTQQVPHDAWDIAFSNLGADKAGIFFNESTASSMGQPTTPLEAYDPFVFDFSETIDPTGLTEDLRLYNPETTWSEGAFNTMRDTANAQDFGWGYFNPMSSKITGSRVFVLKLRNGQYRKIMFDEYDGATFTFRIANLDGSNTQTKTVNTSFNNGSPVVYYSIANGTNVTTPTDWNMVFCRYVTFLFDGTGYLPYFVTGILVNDGMLSAKASGVDPFNVDYQVYLDSLKNDIHVIGHDWKAFSGVAWSVADDVAYFVKTKDNKLYKIVFTGFEGSFTGTANFEQSYLGELTSAPELPNGIGEVLVFPNPAADRLHVSFTSETATGARMRLTDASGRVVWSGSAAVNAGLNVLEIKTLSSVPAGTYTLTVTVPGGQFSRNVSIGGR